MKFERRESVSRGNVRYSLHTRAIADDFPVSYSENHNILHESKMALRN